MLLSELYTDFKNLETLSYNASILITVHPSFVFFFATGYHTAIACSDSDFVCTVDALTETFLSSTPAQHEKARGKRRTWSVVDIILLGFRLPCTCDCGLLVESVKFYFDFIY